MQEKVISVPIYPFYLHLIKTDDFSKIAEDYNLDLPDYSDAFCFEYEGAAFMVFGSVTKPDVIAHEALHAVNIIFKGCGVQLDLDNDEPQAYMLSWVYKKCHKFLKK